MKFITPIHTCFSFLWLTINFLITESINLRYRNSNSTQKSIVFHLRKGGLLVRPPVGRVT